jgi:hypothetical protein
MLRSSLVASAVALLCAAASAQQVNLSRVQPITSPVKHAGVFNLSTGKFQPAGQTAHSAVVQNIYNNTCTWAGGAFYVGTGACEDDYDEGRIPPGGVGANHKMNLFEFGYCSSEPTGTVDIDAEVYNTQVALGGGACTFGTAGTPPVFTAGLVGFQSSTSGFPLPGSTGAGFVGCWIVGFTLGTATVCINSGITSADQFVWRFSTNNNNATPGGPILSGEPLIAGGAGTFGFPPGTDPISGTPCGHGLNSQDSFWANVDNTIVGGVPPAGCLNAPGAGTNCYWFGGYPTNPFAGFWFRVEGDGSCTCSGSVTPYCTAKTNSLGCVPTVTSSGAAPSVSGCASAFNLTANSLLGNKNGLWFYGTNGLNGVAFQGGHLCVKPAIKRLSVQSSGGQGTACNGTMTTNFNARICSGSDAALTPGALVGTQCWSRDPASASTTNLTSAISFIICP